MPRYIDADELKIDYGFTWDDITPTHDELYALIDRQPTADVVERKRGKWIKSNESVLRPYMCSECGAFFDVDTVLGKLSWQYCPACGTEMRGSDDA